MNLQVHHTMFTVLCLLVTQRSTQGPLHEHDTAFNCIFHACCQYTLITALWRLSIKVWVSTDPYVGMDNIGIKDITLVHESRTTCKALHVNGWRFTNILFRGEICHSCGAA